jgi:hypothetical protein
LNEILSRRWYEVIDRERRRGVFSTRWSTALNSLLIGTFRLAITALQEGGRRICAADAKKRGKPLLDQSSNGTNVLQWPLFSDLSFHA